MTATDTVRDAEAEELMEAAHRLIQAGNWAQAGAELARAAQLHQAAGRPYDEARCLQLAATLERSAGNTERSRVLADAAAAVPADDKTLAVSIASEQAEIAVAENRHEDAALRWQETILYAREAQARPENLSALLLRLGAAQVATGRIQEAAASFDKAASGSEQAGFVRTEQAGVLFEYGFKAEAIQILQEIDYGADTHLRADVLVLRARLARASGTAEQAVEYAREARAAALEAVAPVSYFAASLELAQAFEVAAGFTDTYGTLATAQATLGDVLGTDVARTWVEPVLAAYQLKWGEAAFSEARNAYEVGRRRG